MGIESALGFNIVVYYLLGAAGLMHPRTRVHDWASITLDEGDTFAAALELMNCGGYQLALVRRADGHLAGMVTDSDIRKALLRGIDLQQPVAAVMNATPLVVSPELGEAEAHQLMLLNHFFHLPVVDGSGCLVGLHVAEQLHTPTAKAETLVIMAGGRGQRLMPLTAQTPKPMLPIHGKPILQHIIERAKLDGFINIVISVNYMADQIVEAFGNGSGLGMSIFYIHETEPLGTAGALALLPQELQTDLMVVTNGDIITGLSYSDILDNSRTSKSDGNMAVRLEKWQSPFGVVESSGSRFIGVREKPVQTYSVNAGIYVVSKTLIRLIPENTYCDMTDLFNLGLSNGLNLTVYPLHESWIDIGRPADYKQASSMVNSTN
jgi:dTDP-glucose pyrophosphorylase/CBS domain-containing protein